MSEPIDPARDSLTAAWQSAQYPLPSLPTLSAELQQRVTSGTRNLVVGTLVEVALTIGVFGAMALQPGVFSRPGATAAWALAILHGAVIWGFTLWNRRGILRPFTESTEAFLALLVRRAERKRLAASFTLAIVVTEGTAGLVAMLLGSEGGIAGWVARHAGLSIVVAAFAALCLIYAARESRTARSELEWLSSITREVS